MTVLTGLDVLAKEGFARLKGCRIGVLAHAASVDRNLLHIVDLLNASGIEPRVLFAPEHGLFGAEQDMVPVAGTRFGKIPVVSLYGSSVEQLRPPRDALSEIELLVVDLQDVGARYYTYAATMRYCLEECAGAGVRVLVLDRPNPLGGERMEGPLLAPGLRSFVGEFEVPVRHGMTIAELARCAVSEGIDVELDWVPMKGWKRNMWFDDTGLPWVMPSPNMPSLETAIVYPGMCLLEATNVSEGRGTTRPFEIFGAPWLDGHQLKTLLQPRVEGVALRPLWFRPAFQKHAGVVCGGVQVHVTDRDAFEPFRFGLEVLWALRKLLDDDFQWRRQPYEFVTDRPAIDLLAGCTDVRRVLDEGGNPADLAGGWTGQLRLFAERRKQWLLYQEEPGR